MNKKELQKTFSETEIIILEAYGKGFFKNVDKAEIFGKCRELADKKGGTGKTYYNRFKDMLKYGTFEKYFPESKAKRYIQVSFRMSEDLHKDLKAKSYKLNKSLNKLITQAVKRSLR